MIEAVNTRARGLRPHRGEAVGVASALRRLDWWLLAFWVVVLAGLVGGKVYQHHARWQRRCYLVVLAYLLALLAIAILPEIAPRREVTPEVRTYAEYVLPLAFVLPIAPTRFCSTAEFCVNFKSALRTTTGVPSDGICRFAFWSDPEPDSAIADAFFSAPLARRSSVMRPLPVMPSTASMPYARAMFSTSSTCAPPVRTVACTWILLHHTAERYLGIGAPIVVHAQAETELSECLGRLVDREAVEYRHLDLPRAQRHAHRDAEEDQEGRAEQADEQEELTDAPDPCPEPHLMW